MITFSTVIEIYHLNFKVDFIINASTNQSSAVFPGKRLRFIALQNSGNVAENLWSQDLLTKLFDK